MKVLSIISQKGGAGKTTLAVNIASAAVKVGKKTVVLDLDPQGSASSWGDSRQEQDPTVLSIQPSRLEKVLETAKEEGADLIVIDTAPHSESSSLMAAKLSDFVVIPCRPSIFDLRAIINTIDIISIAKKQYGIILNAIPPRGVIASDAESALKEANLNLLPVQITQRASFIHAATEGKSVLEFEPSGKGAQEIVSLYNCIQTYL